MAIKIFQRFRRGGNGKKEMSEEPKKSLAELIDEYNRWRVIISFANAGKTSPLPDDDVFMQELKKIEGQIIDNLPDELQKSVFAILARHKFDITDFLGQKDWRTIFKEVCQEICHFLYCGSPLTESVEWSIALPVSGEEFFFHLLNCARIGEEEPCSNLWTAVRKMIEDKKVMEHDFDCWSNIGGRLIVVFAGEFARQSAVLVDILCEIEDGRNLIKEILNLE